MSLPEQLITENLDIWTNAIKPRSVTGRGRGKGKNSKHELYGIKKLRELVLELAVRGLLVPQDPSDEPASELIKKIEIEKEKLIKDKKIKKPKALSPISADEKPFKLPEGWSLARLGELSYLITKGTTPTSIGYTFESSGISFLKIENLDRGRIEKKSISQFISEKTNEALARSQLCPGDLLFSIAGTIGKTAIIYEDDLPANTNQALAIIRGTSTVYSPSYLRIQLDSFVAEKTRRKARGGAMPNVSLGDLTVLVSPIPPLAEQHRIAAKVDELMALCDQLEQQTEASLTAHKTLVETLLGTLVNAADNATFEEAWQRIADHFDALFTTEHSIDQLKQTILQLAVMGQLVPQDPNDEPATELFKRAKFFKEEIASTNKIRRDKESYKVFKLFDAPQGWKWSCIGQFSHVLGGKRVPRGYSLLDTPTEHVYIRVTDMKDNTVIQDNLKYIDEDIYEQISKYVINKEDVYVTIAGTIGAIGTIPENLDGMNLTENASKVVFRDVNQEFLVLALSSSYIQKQFEDAVNQMAQPKLSLTSIKHTSIAIPPLKEQESIAAKVDELMALCNQLKQQLVDAKITQVNLANAIVDKAVA